MEEIENSEIHITSRLEIDHLHLHPNKHIVLQAIRKHDLGFEPEYFYFDDFDAKRTHFINLNDIQVFKTNIKCDITFTKTPENHNKKTLKDFLLEFYIVYRDSNDIDPLLLNLDDLLFYLNWNQNHLIKKEEKFPELKPCFYNEGEFNFISSGRELYNKYFPNYSGGALDLDFEDELIESYALLSNNLSFLYRYKDRVFEEIAQYDNSNYQSSLFMYPRFNNAISETAGSIYNFWERIAFFINEFYPLNANSKAPSYWRYFDEVNKRAAKNSTLRNTSLGWFVSRLGDKKEQERLNDLRHSLIHYNKAKNVKGIRSASFIENRPDKNETIKEWKAEILFLRNELDNISIALEKVIGLIETWASAGVTI